LFDHTQAKIWLNFIVDISLNLLTVRIKC